MASRPDSALIIIGHGSTLNPDSSQPTHAHADTIRRMGIFREVVCAFWKEEPGLREVLRTVDSPEVYVVPNFISEGYFTQEVIPRELGLTERTTVIGGRTVHYCDPVGLHPSMTKLLLKRAAEVAPGVPREASSLIIVGHGTGLNENSTKAIRDQVALIRSQNAGFVEVLDAYMEEPPLIADWVDLTTAPNGIVVPFFIADGLHSYQDIPVLLGIEKEPTAAASRVEVFRRNPYELRGRRLYFSSAIGTEPHLADVILDQVEAFDAAHRQSAPDITGGAPSLDKALMAWLESGAGSVGEVIIRRSENGGWSVRHRDDAQNEPATLTIYDTPEAAREVAKYDAAGEFRPLKSAPSLARGWEIRLPDLPALRLTLEFLYPAALGNWLRFRSGDAVAPTLRAALGSQTGIYRVTALIRDDEADGLVAGTCGAGCLRRVMWSLDGKGPWTGLPADRQSGEADSPDTLPLLCLNPCQILVGGARSVVKRRMKAEKEAADAAPAG